MRFYLALATTLTLLGSAHAQTVGNPVVRAGYQTTPGQQVKRSEIESRVRNIVVAGAEPQEAASSAVGKTWVLAVGVEEYRNVGVLKFTGEDATAFGRAFREVGQVPSRQVFVIADHEKDSLPLATDSATLKAFLRQLTQQMGPQDTLIFFFSGHGVNMPRGEMFLATKDFDLRRPEQTGLSIKFLRQTLVDCPAKNQFVFLDACHSGAFNNDRAIDGKQLANELAARQGVAVISSCTGPQESGEHPQLKMGIFTHWLVQGLRGRANYQADPWIDVHEIFRFVSQNVPATAKKLSKLQQTPVFAAKNLSKLAKVLDLKRPDRPSVLIAAKNDVPVGNIGFGPGLINAMANAAAADPVLIIGRLKWIMQRNKPGSPSYVAADKALQRLDNQILKGIIQLPAAITGRK